MPEPRVTLQSLDLKIDGINNRLDVLNGRTTKNTDEIAQVKLERAVEAAISKERTIEQQRDQDRRDREERLNKEQRRGRTDWWMWVVGTVVVLALGGDDIATFIERLGG